MQLARGSEALADAVGEVFAVGVGDGQGHNASWSVAGDVGDDGVGEGFPGGVWGAEVVFPAVVFADGLAGGDEAGPVAGEGLPFGGFELPAVLGQLGAVGAMVDRLVHHAEVIVLQGESYRLKDRGKEVTPTKTR